MRYGSLYAFYFVYFIMVGFSAFVPKYYGELGLSDGMIGVLTSVPTVVAMAFSPLLGLLTDRVRKKRHVLTGILAIMAAICFMVARCEEFSALLLVVTLYTIFSTSALPLATTISLEYTSKIGRQYGPIRLTGTVGYQVGALLIGYLLSRSLRSLYPLMGAAILVSCAATLAMPNVEGHQHNRKRVPLSKLFADRHVRWMYLMILFATVSSQFYQAFFTKHLGDLGMSNAEVSWVTLLSVIAELPFLYFGDRIARKTSIWNWILLGMVCNGIRWLGLAFSRSIWPILLFQIPGVTVLACFEFFPSLDLNRRVPAELSGSAQNMLSLTSFGLAKIIGGLIGGQVCERTGIPALFAFFGGMLLVGSLLFLPMTRRLIQEEASPV